MARPYETIVATKERLPVLGWIQVATTLSAEQGILGQFGKALLEPLEDAQGDLEGGTQRDGSVLRDYDRKATTIEVPSEFVEQLDAAARVYRETQPQA